MITEDNNIENATWPTPKFKFEVDLGIGDGLVVFQEVSGMDVENQIIEYRKSDSPIFSSEQMPGIVKYGNVTMKRGLFISATAFWNWYEQIKMNTITKRTIVIKLLDERNTGVMQWQLNNAWPIKITTTDIVSDANEVAVDILEIAHEQLIITIG